MLRRRINPKSPDIMSVNSRSFVKICLVAALVIPAQYLRASYVYFTAAGTGAVQKYSANFRVDDAPMAKTYYWAYQTNFNNGSAMYIGIQPRSTQAAQLAIFSVFGSGTRALAGSTSNGADGGAGTSGSITYPWLKGRTYSLTIENVTGRGENADEEAWSGCITDSHTMVKTEIACYAVPKSRGGLSKKLVFFSEYFIYNGVPVENRDVQRYARVRVGTPTVKIAGATSTTTRTGTKNESTGAIDTTSPTTTIVENGMLDPYYLAMQGE